MFDVVVATMVMSLRSMVNLSISQKSVKLVLPKRISKRTPLWKASSLSLKPKMDNLKGLEEQWS